MAITLQDVAWAPRRVPQFVRLEILPPERRRQWQPLLRLIEVSATNLRLKTKEIYLRRPLSRRRTYALMLLGRGLPDRKVAETMGITLGTLRNYLPQLRIEFHLSSLEEVRRVARRKNPDLR